MPTSAPEPPSELTRDRAATRVERFLGSARELDRLREAVLLLYELSAPGRVSEMPVFAEFAQRLVVDHPADHRRRNVGVLRPRHRAGQCGGGAIPVSFRRRRAMSDRRVTTGP